MHSYSAMPVTMPHKTSRTKPTPASMSKISPSRPSTQATSTHYFHNATNVVRPQSRQTQYKRGDAKRYAYWSDFCKHIHNTQATHNIEPPTPPPHFESKENESQPLFRRRQHDTTDIGSTPTSSRPSTARPASSQIPLDTDRRSVRPPTPQRAPRNDDGSISSRIHHSRSRMSHLSLPNDSAEAKKLWSGMKEQINAQWNKYQNKIHKTPPQQQTQSPPPPPASAAPVSAAPAPSSSEAALPSRDHSSSSYAFTNVSRERVGSIDDESLLSSLSIASLRALMCHYGLSSSECIEKSDLIQHITQYQRNKRSVPTSAAIPRTIAAVSESDGDDAVVSSVESWSRNKSLHQILNELLRGSGDGADMIALHTGSSYTEYHRAYKRVLLRIHPDKHMFNRTAHCRANEIVKVVNSKWDEYKRKLDRK